MERTLRALAITAFVLLTARPAFALPAGLDPGWCESKNGQQVIGAARLLRALESQGLPLSDEFRDLNEDGTITTEESYEAIRAAVFGPPRKDSFIAPSDVTNAQDIYGFFAHQLTGQLRGTDFAVVDAGGAPAKDVSGKDLVKAWAKSASRYWITCVHAQGAQSDLVASNDNGFSIVKDLRVRGNADDLVLAAQKSAAAVTSPLGNSSAAFSWQRDQLAGTTSLKVQAAAGLRIELDRNPIAGLRVLMPYISINRVDSGDPKKKSQNVDNLATGMGIAGTIGRQSPLFVWQVRPEVDSDDSFRSAVGYVSARIDLANLDNVFCFDGNDTKSFLGGFRVSCDVAALADAGSVFDDGGLAAIKALKSYRRIGYSGGAVIAGNPDDDFWKNWAVTADYKDLWDYSGNRQNLGRFEAQLVYKIAPAKSGPSNPDNPALNFQIALQYQDGRVDVTRQREQQWLITLGAQY